MKSFGPIALTLMAVTTAWLPGAQAAPAARSKTAPSKLPALPKGIGGTWTIDPMHSHIGFSIPHLTISNVQGAFDEFEGTIKVDEKNFSRSSVSFSAKVASIDTNVAKRDEHLRSADFFDAAKYPLISFKSSRIDRTATGLRALGTLTMHGVSKQIVIPFTRTGPINDGWGFWRSGISASILLNRQDYGVKYNQVMDSGGLAVGNTVKVSLDLEATRPVDKKPVDKK